MENKAKEKKERKPMGFWKTMLASTVGVVVAFLIVNMVWVCIMTMFLAGAVSGMGSSSSVTGNNLFVKLDMTRGIVECSQNEAIMSMMSTSKNMGMDQLMKSIEEAKNDNRVAGLYLYFGSGGSASWAQSEELRNALIDFKEACGKPIIAYSDNYSQADLYLASVADKVVLHPAGMVDFRGLGAEVMFYKDLLDKFDVKMELIRPVSNAYKSAGETYTMNHLSDANREQVRAYVTSVWNHVVEQMAQSRNLTPEQLNDFADNLSACMAEDAVAKKLVDTLALEKYVTDYMEEAYQSKKMVAATKYADSFKSKAKADKIAVIYAEGDVVSGKSNGFKTAVYGDDIAKALDEAADDKSVKAIVLRVNSPGGGVLASEIMTAAVMRAKEKKPLVVSMSTLAASAGYEISCNADCIVAQPTTITGSIGVFAAFPMIGDALRNKLGITTDTVNTNRNSTGMTMMRALSPDARALMQRNVEEFYVTFCERVAKGRNLDVKYVDSIARGRVWTGAEAIKIGLVDTLGGMNTALAIAADKAGISDYSVTNYPKAKKWYESIMELGEESEEARIEARIEKLIPGYKELYYWATAEEMQARLPYYIDIR